jgi:fluoride exporter
MLQSSIIIALGGAIGSVLRFWLAELMTELAGPAFPWGTLIANISGSFVIGFVAFLAGGGEGGMFGGPLLRQFLMIGICGGFTTFSSFSLQTLTLAQNGQWGWLAFNVLGSVALCLIGVWLGHWAAMSMNAAR